MKLKNIIIFICMFGMFNYLPKVSADPYPLEYFALRDVISNVSISPDGNKLALHKIPSKDGDPVLEIYNANDLSKEPFRVNADPMEIRASSWVSDDQMILLLRQKVKNKIDGFNRGVYREVLAKLDVEKRKIKEFKFDGQSPSIASFLVDKPNKILIGFNGDKSYFSPTDYYELDLKSGRKKLILKGTPAVPSVSFDAYGNPIYGSSFNRATGMYSWHIRKPGSTKWSEIYKFSENSFETFNIQGADPQNPNILFVVAHNGRDTAGLWEFDINQRKFGELIYARKDVDILGTRLHSNSWTNPDEIVGIRYKTNKSHYEYFDEVEAASYKQLETGVPFSYELSIRSRSRDGNSLTVFNRGPKDPGTYYLLKNGQLKIIGSTNPLLDKEKLADVKMISYKSRHGETLRGYLTVPNGKGPFPLVVMPHGGPYVSVIPAYDEWGQMFANNGYMVFEPEFRGSKNRGLKFYKSAFINGSEAGRKMQDDKDDGANHLIKQGLVDKDRVAMYGWSYGGYAALVAASRDNQIYQCTMAGAAVSDPIYQNNLAKNERWYRGTAAIEQDTTWKSAISPVKEVNKVNIPILLIHGSVDQRVPIKNVEKYISALKKNNNSSYKYIELEGEDHFGGFSFENQLKLYNGLIDYLKNDCGPGGL